MTDVEVNIVLLLVGHERTEESADHTVPSAQVLLDELFLDEAGDALLFVALVDG